jgi:hypothetical protein
VIKHSRAEFLRIFSSQTKSKEAKIEKFGSFNAKLQPCLRFAKVAVSMSILVKFLVKLFNFFSIFPNFPQSGGLFMDNLGKNWQESYG